MQQFSTLHTDTWVHKNPNMKFGVRLKSLPYDALYYVLLCSKKLSVYWQILLIKDIWDKTLEDAMTHAIHKLSFWSILDIYLDNLDNLNLV